MRVLALATVAVAAMGAHAVRGAGFGRGLAFTEQDESTMAMPVVHTGMATAVSCASRRRVYGSSSTISEMACAYVPPQLQ